MGPCYALIIQYSHLHITKSANTSLPTITMEDNTVNPCS